MTPRPYILRLLGFAVLATPVAARAELPEPVRAMIDAAIATGDKQKVATVVDLAKQAYPQDAAEIDAIQHDFQQQQRELAAAAKARKEEELRTAGIFENWSGKGQVGFSQSSGNSNNLGVNLALGLERKGIDWSHRIKATTDIQRNNGRTNREQFLLSYEPRYVIGEDLFTYGLAQFERDRFQGFSGRYAVSGGVGYRVIDKPSVDLSIQAGPAFRRTEFTDGTTSNSIGGLAAIDFDWRITDTLTFTQDTNVVAESGSRALVIVDSSNTSLALTTGLEAIIAKGLSTRMSYAIEYDSNPPPGKVSTDKQTRFTLVYGF